MATLAERIAALHARVPEMLRLTRSSVEVNSYTANVAGTATNTVPDSAEAVLDLRFETQPDARALVSTLRRGAQQCAVAGTALRVQGGIKRLPMDKTPTSHALYQAYAECQRAAGLGSGEHPRVGGGSDANTVAGIGLPVIDGLGPRGGGFHTTSEYVELVVSGAIARLQGCQARMTRSFATCSLSPSTLQRSCAPSCQRRSRPRLDWSSLELAPGSFIDERLAERQADLLFTIRCGGHGAYLYVLLEHQSTSDGLMAFRLLRYLVRIWDAFLVEHPESGRLPAIIPVVVHHSSKGWSAGQDLRSLIDLDAATLALVGPYVPQFRFMLDDLAHADEEALRGRSLSAVATARLMLLSRGRSAANLLEELRRWLDVLGQVARARNGVEALSAFLEYAFRVGEVLPEQLRALAQELGPAAEEAYMTAAQKLTAESYARGIAEGKAEGEAKGRAEGKAEGKAELLIRQLGLRFGSLPESVLQRIRHAAPDRLDVWAERVVTGHSLEDIFR